MKKTCSFLLAAICLAIVSTMFFACSDLPSDLFDGSSDSGGTSQISSGSDGSSSSVFVPAEETYLGYGYDVIKSGYINRDGVKISHPILNKEKMFQNAIIDSAVINMQRYETFTGRSIKQFYQERNAGINLGYAGGISGFFFSGGFKTEFSNATNESMKESIYYSRVRSYRYTQDNYIKNATSQNLSGYLTESFRADLQTLSASNLLDRYGTHVFIRYYKGGSLEANYTYTGTKLTNNTSVKNAVDASFAGISGGVTSSNSTDKTELESNTSFKYYAYGGKALGSTNMSQLKGEYGTWVKSIASNADICGIPNDFAQGLMPIWELAQASGNRTKATELQNEFKRRATEQGVALPGARIYKTAEFVNRTTSGVVSLKPPTGGTIAEIEIYALGAGGGGQGGNYNSGIIFTERGTGGSGGGGSAAYLKLGNNLGLEKDGQVSLTVTIGAGGTGGNETTTSATNAGCGGGNGGITRVVWSTKSITLNAPGGSGGGPGSTTSCTGSNVKGGTGGIKGTVSPSSSSLYVVGTPFFESGTKGDDGLIDHSTNNRNSNGGRAALISNKGTLSSFGGNSGASYTAGSAYYNGAKAGGGGIGLWQQAGINGGDGLVTIVYKYYTEE